MKVQGDNWDILNLGVTWNQKILRKKCKNMVDIPSYIDMLFPIEYQTYKNLTLKI